MAGIDSRHRNHFTNLYLIAICDGECHPSEMQFLHELGAKKGLTTDEVDDIIANPHKARFIKPLSLIDAIEQLYDMGQMVCADGRIHPYQVDLCKSFSRKFDLKEDIIDEVVEKLIDEVNERVKKFNNEKSDVIINHLLEIIQGKKQLSPIEISNNYRIFLPAFNNAEVKLTPLAKSVYLLFLRHINDGIYLKKLCEHKPELLDLYAMVSNKSETGDIVKTIEELINMRSNSIHENRSRINKVFSSLMHDSIAANYCIEGNRGEPYKVHIPSYLVRFPN